MPMDPEEMQALLARARPLHKRNPVGIDFILQGTRMTCGGARAGNGFSFELPLPMGQRFMTSLRWSFSNTK